MWGNLTYVVKRRESLFKKSELLIKLNLTFTVSCYKVHLVRSLFSVHTNNAKICFDKKVL